MLTANICVAVLLCARYGKGRVMESFTVTSGTTAVRPTPGIANLIGGGGALVSATRGLALDLAPVRVNCVMPGLLMTEMLDVREDFPLSPSSAQKEC